MNMKYFSDKNSMTNYELNDSSKRNNLIRSIDILYKYQHQGNIHGILYMLFIKKGSIIKRKEDSA